MAKLRLKLTLNWSHRLKRKNSFVTIEFSSKMQSGLLILLVFGSKSLKGLFKNQYYFRKYKSTYDFPPSSSSSYWWSSNNKGDQLQYYFRKRKDMRALFSPRSLQKVSTCVDREVLNMLLVHVMIEILLPLFLQLLNSCLQAFFYGESFLFSV